MEVLVKRDTKGLYKQALAGLLAHFTGVSDPYEPPDSPDLTIHTSLETPEESVERILETLRRMELLLR